MIDDKQFQTVRQRAAQNVLNKIRDGGTPTEAEWDLLYEHRQKPTGSSGGLQVPAKSEQGTMLKNARHEKFCQNIANGMVNTDAYIQAGYKAQRRSAATESGKLLKNPDIEKRIREIRELLVFDSILTRTQALERLTELTRSDKRAIAAIQEIARLQGWYPDKSIDVQAGGQMITMKFRDATDADFAEAKKNH